jgi:hypothetical protein
LRGSPARKTGEQEPGETFHIEIDAGIGSKVVRSTGEKTERKWVTERAEERKGQNQTHISSDSPWT